MRNVPIQRRGEDSMSLLTEVMTRTVDADYAAVARRRASGERPRTSSPVPVLAVLALFGLLLATTALSSSREEPALEAERAELVERIESRSAVVQRLRREVTSLQGQVADLQARAATSAASLLTTQQRVEALALVTGTAAATGPGIVVTVDDAAGAESQGPGQVLDTDLRRLVNGLWLAGAEAIAINGQRITSRTAIRGAGEAITVNFRSLGRPYVLSVIGNPDTLPARLLETPAGQAWLDLSSNVGVRFDTQTSDSVTVPGRPLAPLAYAEPVVGQEGAGER